jgi:YggT family protein
VVLVLAEAVYTVTDPPLKALRRVIPPLSLGSVRLDLAFLVLMLAVSVTLNIL